MTGFAGQFMTFPLAQKRGFLKEEGFEAEIVRISAGAGRVGFNERRYRLFDGHRRTPRSTEPLPAFQFESWPALSLLRCLAWVTRPEFKTVQALKGKTIAILFIPGGVAHFAARAMVRHGESFHVEKEMKYLAVGPPDARFAALTQGLVEAGNSPASRLRGAQARLQYSVAGRRPIGSPRDRLGHQRQENSLTGPMKSNASFAPASKLIVTFAPIAMVRFSS